MHLGYKELRDLLVTINEERQKRRANPPPPPSASASTGSAAATSGPPPPSGPAAGGGGYGPPGGSSAGAYDRGGDRYGSSSSSRGYDDRDRRSAGGYAPSPAGRGYRCVASLLLFVAPRSLAAPDCSRFRPSLPAATGRDRPLAVLLAAWERATKSLDPTICIINCTRLS